MRARGKKHPASQYIAGQKDESGFIASHTIPDKPGWGDATKVVTGDEERCLSKAPCDSRSRHVVLRAVADNRA